MSRALISKIHCTLSANQKRKELESSMYNNNIRAAKSFTNGYLINLKVLFNMISLRILPKPGTILFLSFLKFPFRSL